MILRLRLYVMSLRISTYLLSIAAFGMGLWFWRLLSQWSDRPAVYVPHLGHLLFGVLVWTVLSEQYKVTNFDELFRERTGARNASSACVATSFVALAALFFSRDQLFPRGLLVCDILALLICTIVLHAVFRLVCRTRAHFAKPVSLLIIGADDFAVTAGTRLKRLSFAPCEIAGYVRLPGQQACVSDDRAYDFEDLKELANGRIDEAVIAIRPVAFDRLPNIIETLTNICLPARAIVDFGQTVVVKKKLFQLGSMQMLDLASTPTESLDYVLLKRAFDVCFSALLLVSASPLFALLAALVKVTSSGPVFFAQERVGLSGKPFHMYKFRTMRISAKSSSDTQWTTKRDPRVTAIGTILRKTSLDELPQFINVLKGEMSVVGPRPERPHFVQQFLQEISRYNTRHSLKVGITGWAQVNGWRGDTSIEKRIEYDLYYLQNWTFVFDIKIIILTMFSALIAKNAY